MVPSFNSKTSPTNLQLQSFTYKSFNTKASPTKASPINASPTKDSPTIASPTKASPTKVSPTILFPRKKKGNWEIQQSFTIKASPTKASSIEDSYKFSKASHYLDQDSVKQNQFMVPNKSFNSKASPTKLQLQSFTYKSFNTKASPTKLQLQSFTYKASTQKLHHKSFTNKSFTNTTTNSQKLHHYLDQDSVKQNQFMVPNKALPQKLHQWRTTTNSQKLHTILIKIV
ncbi:hypothetical protein ACFX1S_013727 [Malus domestica]